MGMGMGMGTALGSSDGSGNEKSIPTATMEKGHLIRFA